MKAYPWVVVSLRSLLTSTVDRPRTPISHFTKFLIYTVTLYVWLQTGFRLVNKFIYQLQIVTASNHSAIASSHTLQFTTALTKSSPACNVSIGPFLVTAQTVAIPLPPAQVLFTDSRTGLN
jgi:hypothetical protein